MSLRRTFFQRSITLSAALLVAAAPALAQPSPRVVTVPEGPAHVFTVNPFFLLAGWIAVEYEQRLSPSLSLGGGFNHTEYSDDRYTDFDFKARLYASEHALRGLSIGLSLGGSSINIANYEICTPAFGGCNIPLKRTISSPSIGIELNYQWLLGSSRHTAIAVGFGGKRFLASDETLRGTGRVIPTFRLGLGYGF